MTRTLFAAALCAAVLAAAPALAQTAGTSASPVTTAVGPTRSTIQTAPLPDLTPNAIDTPAPTSGASSIGPSTTPGPSTNDDGSFNRGAANDTATPAALTSGGR